MPAIFRCKPAFLTAASVSAAPRLVGLSPAPSLLFRISVARKSSSGFKSYFPSWPMISTSQPQPAPNTCVLCVSAWRKLPYTSGSGWAHLQLPCCCDFKPLQSPCPIQGGLQVWTSGSDTVTTQPLLSPVGPNTHTGMGLRQPRHSLYWAGTPPGSAGRTGARMSERGPSGLLRVTYGAAGRAQARNSMNPWSGLAGGDVLTRTSWTQPGSVTWAH